MMTSRSLCMTNRGDQEGLDVGAREEVHGVDMSEEFVTKGYGRYREAAVNAAERVVALSEKG